MIRRRRDAGRWVTRTEGVYALADHPTSWRSELWVAVLAPSRTAAVSFEAAAAVHAMATFRPGPVVVTVEHSRTRAAVGVVHQSRRLYDEHLTEVDGLPVTTVARTIVDLAANHRRPRIELVLDDALARGSLRIPSLLATYEDLVSRGRRGLTTIRRLLVERQPGYIGPSTVAESLLLRALRRGGLPRPVLQFPHPGVGIDGFVDGAYPNERLLLEVDSRRWHTRQRDFANDRARDNAATAAGFRTLRFTWNDVSNHPDDVAGQVRQVLATAA